MPTIPVRMVCPSCRHVLVLGLSTTLSVEEFEDRTAMEEHAQTTAAKLVADAAKAVEEFKSHPALQVAKAIQADLERGWSDIGKAVHQYAGQQEFRAAKHERGAMKIMQHVEKDGVQFEVTVQALDVTAHKMLTALSPADYDELRLALYNETMKVITKYVSKEA